MMLLFEGDVGGQQALAAAFFGALAAQSPVRVTVSVPVTMEKMRSGNYVSKRMFDRE